MAYNIPHLYADVLYALRTEGKKESSRNGQVITIPRPTLWTVVKPEQRVLFNPERKANPFFHVMEAVWMLAGEDHVAPLLPFNSRMKEYAEGDGRINGAYGHRWINKFGRNQILDAIDTFKRDPNSRQVVLQMWSNTSDGTHLTRNDRPCNTHIYLRRVNGCLDMTVCNRSNDAIWGMTGANAVHMTILQEYIANVLSWPVGSYHVMTNNLHIYEHHWPLMENPLPYDVYEDNQWPHVPIINYKDDHIAFLYECKQLIKTPEYRPLSSWLKNVVVPMRDTYLRRKAGERPGIEQTIGAPDWRYAANLWREWHE